MRPTLIARPGAASTRFGTSRCALLFAALLGLTTGSAALAANECSVKYTYATGNTTSSQTKSIDSGQSIDIPAHQGSKVVNVRNLKDRMIRVYRTGIGQYVDLAENASDPAVGNYMGGVTLQKVKCLSASASASTPQQTVQQLVNAAYQAVKQATVSHLNQLETWKTQVAGWSQKTASDWGSCPSPGAQTAYNDAKSWRTQIDQALAQAQQIKADADAARTACQNTTNNSALCGSTYNSLPVHGWILSLTAARNSVQAGITTLAALQCPSGCSQTAQLTVPTASIAPGGTHPLRFRGKVDLPVCTNLSLGSVGFNPTAVANGNLGQIVQGTPPSCTATTNVGVCTNWDFDALLAELQRVRVVPPDVRQITVDVPTRQITVVTGAAPSSCKQSLRVCQPSGNVTLSMNEGKGLFDAASNCTNYVTVACKVPPFGLQPTTEQVSVPDPAQATVRWTRPGMGSVRVDLSSPQFAALCRGTDFQVALPKPPVVSMGSTSVALPFICTQLNLIKVVANP